MSDKSRANEGNKARIDASSLWEERLLGNDLGEIDWDRPVSHEDVNYLLRLYPFVQMINSEAVWEETVIPQFSKAPCGWLIHDYGQAMSVSRGNYLFGDAHPELTDEDEGGEGGDADGTVTKQTFDTAEAMVARAIDKGWAGIEIIAGTDFMKWSVWVAAQIRGYTLLGYEPNRQEKEKYERVRRMLKSKETGYQPGAAPSG